MQPFAVKLGYNAGHWMTVDLEVGHDEVQCTLNPESVIADDLVDLFALLRLPKPGPVSVTAVEHQLLLRAICERLFRYRAAHAWPTTLAPEIDWTSLYAEAADGTPAEADLSVAVAWADWYLQRVVSA